MCDSATTTAFIRTSDSLQSCWIIYSNSQGNERLTVTKTNGSTESTITTGTNDTDSSLDIDSINLMLEPHLRPVTPDPNSRISQQIFQEHKKSAEEYLKVQTQMAYLTRHREELLAAMNPEERAIRLDICQKLKEKEALLKFRDSLKRQLEAVQNQKIIQPQSQSQSQQPNMQPPPQQQPPSSQAGARNEPETPTDESWVFVLSGHQPEQR